MTMNVAIAVVERLKNVEKFTKNRLCFVLNLHLLVLLKPPAYTFISKNTGFYGELNCFTRYYWFLI